MSAILVPTGQPGSDSDAPLRTDAPSTAALGVATAALARFVPAAGETPDQWFTGLAPVLSAQARRAYTGTDPAAVPVHALLGAPSLEPSSTAYLATVDQATDAGPYRVLCSRADDGFWQVERIEPAAR